VSSWSRAYSRLALNHKFSRKKKILFRDPLFSATSMTFQGPQQNRENGIKKYKKKSSRKTEPAVTIGFPHY